MKNKGFVLMETIVVIVVISVALLTIFSSYNKILSKEKIENKYDTSEYLYMTEYIKKYIYNYTKLIQERSPGDCSSGDCHNDIVYNMETPNYDSLNLKYAYFYDTTDNGNLSSDKALNIYNIEKIYILTGFDSFEARKEKFDAYMIDYIRKLDVKDDDKLIIVEYKKLAIDSNYRPLNIYGKNCNDAKNDGCLYETFIASLEW